MADNRPIPYGPVDIPPDGQSSLYGQMPQYNEYNVVTGTRDVSPSISQNSARLSAAFGYNSTVPGVNNVDSARSSIPFPDTSDYSNTWRAYPGRSHQHEGLDSSGRYASSHQSHATNQYNSHLDTPHIPCSYEHTSRSSPESHIVEEGEISEGEYVDTPPIGSTMGLEYGPACNQNAHRLAGSYLAPTGNEMRSRHIPTVIYGHSSELDRPRSASYSPNYDPPDVPQPAHTTSSGPGQWRGPPQVANAISTRAWAPSTLSPQHQENGELGVYDENGRQVTPFQSAEDAPNTVTSVSKSIVDARKEAQNAILNLWPLKVRFQNYIDEGFDENIIRRQFDFLRLPYTTAKSPMVLGTQGVRSPPLKGVQGTTGVQASVDEFGRDQNILATRSGDKSVTSQASRTEATQTRNTTSGLEAKTNNQVEERKDRIARLLSEKGKKGQRSSTSNISGAPTTSSETVLNGSIASVSQATVKADKERLLRQKMEALQKSREARASKAAAKASTGLSPANVSTAIAQNSSPGGVMAEQQAESLLSTLSLPTSDSINRSSTSSIPGLFLASTAPPQSITTNSLATQQASTRKRPIASDFDAPSPSTMSYKRPFGQNRNEQPLVIDVSEEEFSDDDAELDVDVSSDQHSSAGAKITGTTSMRDLPPLSDFPMRKAHTTPSSSITTPPASHLPSRPLLRRPEDLQKKEQEIQEMKRKIAEAERRKKAKQSNSGAQTPRPNETGKLDTPPSEEFSISDKIETSVQIERRIHDESLQVDQTQQKLAEALIKEQTRADKLQESKAERKALQRARLVADVPRVDAEIEENKRKLQSLRDEVSRLESAQQESLEKRRRLNEDLQRLAQETEDQLQAHKETLEKLDSELAADLQPSQSSSASSIDHQHDLSRTTPSLVPIQAGQPDQTRSVKDSNKDSHDIEMTGLDHAELSAAITPANSQAPDANSEIVFHTTTQLKPIQQEGSESDIDMDVSDTPTSAVLNSRSSTSLVEGVAELTEVEGSEGSSNLADAESEAYEPPEATSTVNVEPINTSPLLTPEPPTADSELTRTDLDSSNANKTAVSDQTSHTPFHVPEMGIGAPVPRMTHYTPYESPLKQFHAFRFHPEFQKEVQGGFRSLTYSNSIKTDKEICRYELAGGICNDATCEFQHFRDMGLADDAILVQLGNSAGYSEEDKPKFVSGLRAVLQKLREQKTRDFQIIASEIAAYRARFLGDKSKVLFLDGMPV